MSREAWTGNEGMQETAVIVALVLLLASSHLLLSSRRIRPRLVARLGERRFLAAYSLVALVFFVPLFYHYFTHRHLGPQLLRNITNLAGEYHPM